MTAEPRPVDPRRADEYRIPAVSLRKGDLVNLSPGDDEWQEVLAVYAKPADATDAGVREFLTKLGGNYVCVELTDLASVDNTIYIDTDGIGRINADDGDDAPVLDLLSAPDAIRIYLFTKYELVTTRAVP